MSSLQRVLIKRFLWICSYSVDVCTVNVMLVYPIHTATTDEADSPFEEHFAQLPYFRNRLRTVATKWGDVQRLLRERENQLELCLGNMVVFMKGVEEFLTWVWNQGTLKCLSLDPPADLPELQSYQSGIHVP